MKQNELTPPKGANRARKRVGRGYGSGHVKTSGRGHKGQKSRSGGNLRVGFEGGQNPLILRMPYKKGFNRPFKIEYQIVNLADLSEVDPATEVTPEWLQSEGLVSDKKSSTRDLKVKLLGEGEIKAPLKIKVHKASSSARAKVEAAGGTVEELDAAVSG